MKNYVEDFRFADGITYVRLSGKFPKKLLDDKKNLFQPLIDECKANKSNKALIDATELEVDFDTMELFRAGEDAAHLGRLKIRVAFVAKKDMMDLFFEDVAYNRGGDLRVFTDINDARDWLNNQI